MEQTVSELSPPGTDWKPSLGVFQGTGQAERSSEDAPGPSRFAAFPESYGVSHEGSQDERRDCPCEPWSLPLQEARALASLDTYGTSDEISEVEAGPKGELCGRYINLICTHCGYRHRIYQTCGDRIRCAACRDAWIRDTVRRFTPVLDVMEGCGARLRFITLTIKSGHNLIEQLCFMEAAFSRLKQTVLWRRNVQGGIRVVEITKGKYGWHVHYHVLVAGSFIPQDALSRAWKRATRGSPVVDIRAVYPGAGVVRELFKYTVKNSSLSKAELDEAAAALHGKRLVVTLGSFYRRQVLQEERPVECPDCGRNDCWMLEDVFVGRVSRVMRE